MNEVAELVYRSRMLKRLNTPESMLHITIETHIKTLQPEHWIPRCINRRKTRGKDRDTNTKMERDSSAGCALRDIDVVRTNASVSW